MSKTMSVAECKVYNSDGRLDVVATQANLKARREQIIAKGLRSDEERVSTMIQTDEQAKVRAEHAAKINAAVVEALSGPKYMPRNVLSIHIGKQFTETDDFILTSLVSEAVETLLKAGRLDRQAGRSGGMRIK